MALVALLSLYPARTWAAPTATLTLVNPSTNLGSAQVGTASTTSATLTFTFTSGGSISAPVVVTQGAANRDFTDDGSGSCTTNGAAHIYNNNDTCTVVVDFKPTAVGLRMGAVQLYSSGAVVVSAPIYGVGTGPLAQFPAGAAQTMLGSGYSFPDAVAADGAGDVFVSDLPGATGSIDEIKANGTVQNLVTGLLNPSFGLAVDGAGNVYYTDFANNIVKEIVATNGAVSPSSSVISVGPTIPAPEGMAVDGHGNLFVANGLKVYEIAAVNGAPGSTAVTVGSGWTAPLGVAVDSSGNLFVVDGGDFLTPNSGTVKEVVPAGGVFNSSSTVTTVAQNLNSPGGLAVDAGGNLYVADTGDGVVKEFIATGGVVNTSSLSLTLGSGFNGPDDVVADGKGNLYVSDGGLTSIVKLTLTGAPSLSFNSTAVGSTSTDSPQNVLLQNAGNGNMSIASIALPNPSTSSFALDNGATDCASTMQASSTCTIGIDFKPQAAGSLSDSMVVTDDSLNVANATQTIGLSGTGTPGSTATTTMVSVGITTYDPSRQAVTLSATVMAGSNAATTGTVTFTVKSGSLTIGSAATSGPLSSGGAASVSYSLPAGTAAGGYTVQATYNAGTGYAASSGTGALTINKATPTISTAPTASAITYGQTLSKSTLSGGAASYNSTGVAGSFAFTTPATAPNAGTAIESVIFTPTDGADYSTAAASVSVTVNPAAAAITVTGYSVPYDGNAHTATGTATGIAGVNLAADLTLSGTAHTNAGTYTDSWSFTDPNGNYAPQTGTVTDTIQQLAATVALSNTPAVAYEGGSFTPTLTYSGDGRASVVSQTPAVCTVSAGVVSFVGAGTCMLAASATAGANYTAATGAAQSFWIAPTEPVGSTHATLTATVTIATAGTLGQINLLAQGAPNKDFTLVSGGTCTTGTAYTANQTCTVEFTFTPSAPGQRLGAISLTTGSSSSANLLSTAPIYGMGTGPLAAFPGSTTMHSWHSGFFSPFDVAVDGSGNVYVADAGHNAVKEMVAVNGAIPSSPTILTLGSRFLVPIGVAVDGSGNVYVADSGHNAVKEIVAVNGAIPSNPTILTLASGLSEPYSVAVDGSGNVYVADSGHNAVKEIVAVNGAILSNPTIRILGSGFKAPTGVAVDGSGDVYVADNGNGAVKEIVAVNGVIPSSPTVQTLGSGILDPRGVALNGSGGVFTAEGSTNAIIEIDISQAPALSFAQTAVGQTSSDSPKSVTIQNDGNQPLTFSSIAASVNFALGGTGTCSTSTPLAESGACTVAASFTPTTAGSSDTGTLTVLDNSLNNPAATQTISLSGSTPALTATQTVEGPVTVTFSPAKQVVGLTALVTSSNLLDFPSGTVTFTVMNGSATLCSATGTVTVEVAVAACTLPAATPVGTYPAKAVYNPGAGYAGSSDTSQSLVIQKATPTITTPPTASAITYGQTLANSKLSGGVATVGSTGVPGTPVAGTFMFTSPSTASGAGIHSESIIFTPSDTADELTASGSVDVTVNKAVPAVGLTSSSNPAILTSAVTFTATVTSAAGTPTGSVSFYDGPTLQSTVALSDGKAAYTTSSLAVGLQFITAVYSGDGNFASGTSAAVSELVQDITMSTPGSGTGQPPALTIPPNGRATYVLSIGTSSSAGLPGQTSLSVSNVPAGFTATPSPSILPAGTTTAQVVLTIQPGSVQAPVQQPQSERQSRPFQTGAPLFLDLLLLPFARKLRRNAKRLGRMLLLLVVAAGGLAGMAGLNGCGSSSGFFAQAPHTYTITVTATCEGVSRSLNLLLTVE